MSRIGAPRRLGVVTLVGAAILALLSATLNAESTKPEYLPYATFTSDDTPSSIALKQAYNQAVLRYNQGVYDYHVTLAKHDELVETYNGATTPAERQRARDQAAPLRARLDTLRREVTSRAVLVDQAARRAVAAGLSLK